MTNPNLQSKLLDLATKIILMLISFLLAQLWAKVGAIEEKATGHDKELAQYMIQIARRLTIVETKMHK